MELRRIRGKDAPGDSRDHAGLADFPRWMPRRRDARASRRQGRSGHRENPRPRPRYLVVRSRTRVACARGALDWPATGCRPALSIGYGHTVRPQLLSRRTCFENLERASHGLKRMISGGARWAKRARITSLAN